MLLNSWACWRTSSSLSFRSVSPLASPSLHFMRGGEVMWSRWLSTVMNLSRPSARKTFFFSTKGNNLRKHTHTHLCCCVCVFLPYITHNVGDISMTSPVFFCSSHQGGQTPPHSVTSGTSPMVSCLWHPWLGLPVLSMCGGGAIWSSFYWKHSATEVQTSARNVLTFITFIVRSTKSGQLNQLTEHVATVSTCCCCVTHHDS